MKHNILDTPIELTMLNSRYYKFKLIMESSITLIDIVTQYIISVRNYSTENNENIVNLNKYTREEIHNAIVVHTRVYNTNEDLYKNLGNSNEEELRKVWEKYCKEYRELPNDLQIVTVRELSEYYKNKYMTKEE
jgi:hypothetical protein